MYGIAQNAKRLIRKKCFNQAAVAEKAGYNYKTFNNMLNGRKVITDSDVARSQMPWRLNQMNCTVSSHSKPIESERR